MEQYIFIITIILILFITVLLFFAIKKNKKNLLLLALLLLLPIGFLVKTVIPEVKSRIYFTYQSDHNLLFSTDLGYYRTYYDGKTLILDPFKNINYIELTTNIASENDLEYEVFDNHTYIYEEDIALYLTEETENEIRLELSYIYYHDTTDTYFYFLFPNHVIEALNTSAHIITSEYKLEDLHEFYSHFDNITINDDNITVEVEYNSDTTYHIKLTEIGSGFFYTITEEITS